MGNFSKCPLNTDLLMSKIPKMKISQKPAKSRPTSMAVLWLTIIINNKNVDKKFEPCILNLEV